MAIKTVKTRGRTKAGKIRFLSFVFSTLKKITAVFCASGLIFVSNLPLLDAYEAHIINVTAKICRPSEIKTMGYWKNRQELYLGLLPQNLGDEIIDSISMADKVFMDYSLSMRDKLKGQLLAMKFNIAYFGIGEYMIENESKTLSQISTEADDLLRQNPPPPPDALEKMKNLLDGINGLESIRFCAASLPPPAPPFGPGKVVGWGIIGSRNKPEMKVEIFAYWKFLPEGKVAVYDSEENKTIESIRIDSVMTNIKTRTPEEILKGEIRGKAEVNKEGPYDFTVAIADNGNPPHEGEDTFEITIPALRYSNGGKFVSGNLQVIDVETVSGVDSLLPGSLENSIGQSPSPAGAESIAIDGADPENQEEGTESLANEDGQTDVGSDAEAGDDSPDSDVGQEDGEETENSTGGGVSHNNNSQAGEGETNLNDSAADTGQNPDVGPEGDSQTSDNSILQPENESQLSSGDEAPGGENDSAGENSMSAKENEMPSDPPLCSPDDVAEINPEKTDDKIQMSKDEPVLSDDYLQNQTS